MTLFVSPIWLRSGKIILVLFCSMVEGGAGILEVFDKHCAECHSGEGAEDPMLSSSMDLNSLLSSEVITPGNSAKSTLFKRVTLDVHSKKRMPLSSGQPGDKDYKKPLTLEEIEIIRQWIDTPSDKERSQTGAKTVKENQSNSTTTRNFISDEAILQDAEAVLAVTAFSDKRFTRFLSLANLFNQVEVTDVQLEIYRKAIVKLLNSVSRQSELKIPSAVNSSKTLIRLDLRDYGLTERLWATLNRHYPYAMQNNRGGENLILRADWFVFVLSQPPLYYEALGIPGPNNLSNSISSNKTEGSLDFRLERQLGIDTAENARISSMVRMAFQKSGVSQGNRAIERHELPSGDGYYWKSFDFDPDKRNANRFLSGDLFNAPLGPAEYGLTNNQQHQFKHDGGEIIFSLPNGLQAYMLTGPDGSRLDKGPTNVVQDENHPRGTIINGISCMRCHAQGLLQAAKATENEVAIASLASSGFTREESERIKLMYVPRAKIDEFIEVDSARFQKAIATLQADGPVEPVWALYSQYAFRGVDYESLPSELGIPNSMMPGVLQNPSAHTAVAKMKATSMPRDQFESVFQIIAVEAGRNPQNTAVLFSTEFADGQRKSERPENKPLRLSVVPHTTKTGNGGDDSSNKLKKLLDDEAVEEQIRGIRNRQRQSIPTHEAKREQEANPAR